jgi:hypothetical protein
MALIYRYTSITKDRIIIGTQKEQWDFDVLQSVGAARLDEVLSHVLDTLYLSHYLLYEVSELVDAMYLFTHYSIRESL